MSNTNIPTYETQVPVLGPLSAGLSNSNSWPTHMASLGQGGLEVVNTISEMNAISQERRKDKLVLVRDNGSGQFVFYVEHNGSFTPLPLGDSGTNPTNKHLVYSGFYLTDKGMTPNEVKSNGLPQEIEELNDSWLKLKRDESSQKYMYFWIPDGLGTLIGFRFSGFISAWDKIFPVAIDGVQGKLYMSPHPTGATDVDVQIAAR